MSIKNRIFLFCLLFCILTLTISGYIIIEKTHSDMLDNEIQDLLNYGNSINNTIFTFVMASFISENTDKVSYISDYLKTADRENVYFEIHSSDALIMQTHLKDLISNRADLSTAFEQGKNYLLRKVDNRYYIYVSNLLPLDNTDYTLSIIKDVSYIMVSRNRQYQFFISFAFFAVLLLLAASYYLSKFITKDIIGLTQVTESIKSGDYHIRADISSDDEIGRIGHHINEMAAEIESNIQKLETEAKSKQRFIDNFTHELKTPLTSIIGFADLLRKNKYDKEVFDKGLYYIYDEGKRLSNLSKKMSEIILLKNEDIDIQSEKIIPLLQEVIDVNEMRQYGKELHLKVVGEGFSLPVDKYLFKTVLINLVDNAVKASENNQEIIIGTEIKEKQRIIYVQDRGRGISEEDLDHILEPFYTADKARNRIHQSLGLGLSICSEIIKLHGAELDIQSVENKGTRVEIYFDFTTS